MSVSIQKKRSLSSLFRRNRTSRITNNAVKTAVQCLGPAPEDINELEEEINRIRQECVSLHSPCTPLPELDDSQVEQAKQCIAQNVPFRINLTRGRKVRDVLDLVETLGYCPDSLIQLYSDIPVILARRIQLYSNMMKERREREISQKTKFCTTQGSYLSRFISVTPMKWDASKRQNGFFVCLRLDCDYSSIIPDPVRREQLVRSLRNEVGFNVLGLKPNEVDKIKIGRFRKGSVIAVVGITLACVLGAAGIFGLLRKFSCRRRQRSNTLLKGLQSYQVHSTGQAPIEGGILIGPDYLDCERWASTADGATGARARSATGALASDEAKKSGLNQKLKKTFGVVAIRDLGRSQSYLGSKRKNGSNGRFGYRSNTVIRSGGRRRREEIFGMNDDTDGRESSMSISSISSGGRSRGYKGRYDGFGSYRLGMIDKDAANSFDSPSGGTVGSVPSLKSLGSLGVDIDQDRELSLTFQIGEKVFVNALADKNRKNEQSEQKEACDASDDDTDGSEDAEDTAGAHGADAADGADGADRTEDGADAAQADESEDDASDSEESDDADERETPGEDETETKRGEEQALNKKDEMDQKDGKNAKKDGKDGEVNEKKEEEQNGENEQGDEKVDVVVKDHDHDVNVSECDMDESESDCDVLDVTEVESDDDAVAMDGVDHVTDVRNVKGVDASVGLTEFKIGMHESSDWMDVEHVKQLKAEIAAMDAENALKAEMAKNEKKDAKDIKHAADAKDAKGEDGNDPNQDKNERIDEMNGEKGAKDGIQMDGVDGVDEKDVLKGEEEVIKQGGEEVNKVNEDMDDMDDIDDIEDKMVEPVWCPGTVVGSYHHYWIIAYTEANGNETEGLFDMNDIYNVQSCEPGAKMTMTECDHEISVVYGRKGSYISYDPRDHESTSVQEREITHSM